MGSGLDPAALRSAALRGERPEGLEPLVEALYLDAAGDWEGAHRIAGDVEGPNGAWVHAYLHRKEGDHSNARYWYRQAGKPPSSGALEREWEEIAAALLGGAG